MDPEKSEIRNVSLRQEDLEKIADVLKSSFQNDIIDLVEQAVKSSVSAIIDGFLNGLENKINSLESENISLKNENIALKETISILQATSESAEQYSRRNNIHLSSFPESPGESTDQIVLEICKQLKVDISINELDRSHRKGKPTASGSSRPIIVKFTSYRFVPKALEGP